MEGAVKRTMNPIITTLRVALAEEKDLPLCPSREMVRSILQVKESIRYMLNEVEKTVKRADILEAALVDMEAVISNVERLCAFCEKP